MKSINPDVVPVLPFNGIILDECVAIGSFENGVVVSFLEKNTAILIEWEEVVSLALIGMKDETKKASAALPEVIVGDTREIEKPKR
jgi:hypothetical protein